MLKRLLLCSTLLLLCLLNSSPGDSTTNTAPSVPTGFSPGPDIVAGNMADLEQFGASGTQRGLASGITSCNAGDQFVGYFEIPGTDHPVMAQNLYRMSGGSGNNERFEQIGESWVKHTFGAKQANSCSFGCQPGGNFTHLGVGCSDTYFSSQSADQSQLGSRAWINPFTGVFPSTARDHTGHVHNAVSHMMVVETNDLNTNLNPGATYYAELVYATPDEYAWCQTHPVPCNMSNNASYLQYGVSGTTNFTFSQIGSPVRFVPAINAWPGATIKTIEPEPGVDGLAFLAFKVNGPVGGLYHYEYAIYNLNLDRGIQSFSVPRLLIPGAGDGIGPEENVGFHGPPQHPGFPNDGTQGDMGFSAADWTYTSGAASLTWNSETFAQNPNANAIRWGTLYNFRFDSPSAPVTSNATIGFFKTGAPITVEIQGPAPTGGPSPTPPPTPTPTATPCTVTIFSEDFDGVVPPVLPAGWSSIQWFTSSLDPDTPPNDEVCSGPTSNLNCVLDSPGIAIPSGSVFLRFRNNFDTPVIQGGFWNGGVLEVSAPNISNGEFLDVTDSHVGAVFVAGGYTGVVLENTGNPLSGRMAWGGNSNGYIDTVINLGPNLAGQTIRLRWRLGTITQDDAFLWRIDTVRIAEGVPCPTPTPTPTPIVTPSPTTTPTATPCLVTIWSENFDEVIPPTLPPGWVGNCWVTSNVDPDTPPNCAFLEITPSTTDCVLDRLNITITSAPAVLRFRNNFNTDFSGGVFWDGGVLEVSSPNISNGDFLDITDSHVGGSFISGGYTGEISGDSSSSLAGRMAWSGNSNGYIDTVINLGSNLVGQTITLRWRFGGDGFVSGSEFWRLDTISLTEGLPCPTATPTPTPTPSSTPSTTPGVSPTPTPEAQVLNISTRMLVQTGANVGIGGFIVTGTDPKQILLRGIGPSLAGSGVPNPLPDPILELHGPPGFETIVNDNWREGNCASIGKGLPPTNDLEPCIVATLEPAAYTAILKGNNNTSGVALLEMYDVSSSADANLANLSTRAFVGTGSEVVIAGFIIGGNYNRIALRGVGPSLTSSGVPNALPDPTLELRDSQGTVLMSNDNWQDNAAQAKELTNLGLALADTMESGMIATLPSGAYTAVVAGTNSQTGVGLVEVYSIGPP